MKFHATDIPGVHVIELEKQQDERGFFARSFCTAEFAAAGIDMAVWQANVSRNDKRGTLRGLHYQAAPAPEPKLVRCTRGRVFDVAVDLRRESPAFRRWFAIELDADTHTALYIPAGCAHGFLTLRDDSELLYLMGAAYVPELARGVRWNDPAFAIDWPATPSMISPRDASFPDFDADRSGSD